MPIKRKYDITHHAGFTLLEVLIAVFVLAIGLLGLSGLQATSLRNNQSAYNRSQATQLAYDMADRMRSNSLNNNNLAASTYVTITLANAQAQTDCATVSSSCTTADMAQNDLFQWRQDLASWLPSGTGSIAVNAAARVYTITVSWDDNHSGNVDTNFQMSFQP